MTLNLIPASQYTIKELVEIYNQSRKGYLVPMQMTAPELEDYIFTYDVSLEHSVVARVNGIEAGLGMLGIRQNRSWITRLGVNKQFRGEGVGKALFCELIKISDQLGIKTNILEVIDGNEKAHNLFRKQGFKFNRQLLILNHKNRTRLEIENNFKPLNQASILRYLRSRKSSPAWTNDTETYRNLEDVAGFRMDCGKEGQGWLIYQLTGKNLKRITFGINNGNPVYVTARMLDHLHALHPQMPACAENIPASHPALPAFESTGYQVDFRRIEMIRNFKG